VTALRTLAFTADAFLFATPEYNAAPSAVLKNAIDWLSRPLPPEGTSPLAGKPYAMISAGGSSGGMRAQRALVDIVSDLRMVRVGGQVAVKLWDGVARFDVATGDLMDPDVRLQIVALVKKLEETALQQPG
jgi:chromate reductase